MAEYIAAYQDGNYISKKGNDAQKFDAQKFIFSLPGQYYIFLKSDDYVPEFGKNVVLLNIEGKEDSLIIGKYRLVDFKTFQSKYIVSIYDESENRILKFDLTYSNLDYLLGRIVKILWEASLYVKWEDYNAHMESENENKKLKEENKLLKSEIEKLKVQLEMVALGK